MSTNHGEHCPPCKYEDKIDQSWSAIFVNGHPKGSVMVRMSNVESKVEAFDEKLDRLQETLDTLPKKVLTWLLIVGALIGLLQFIGPSMRKAMGMANATAPVTFTAERQQNAGGTMMPTH